MEDKEYGEKCWRCMSIFRKHQNVLQYRESKYIILYKKYVMALIFLPLLANFSFSTVLEILQLILEEVNRLAISVTRAVNGVSMVVLGQDC